MDNEQEDHRDAGLPVAAPVEEGATTERQDDIVNLKRGSNWKRYVVITFLIATVTIAVVLGIILSRKPDEVTSPASEQESTATVTDDTPPDVTVEEEVVVVKQEVDTETVITMVEEAYVSTRAIMEDPSTPQFRAIEWLTETDEFIYPTDDESFRQKILQRYTVVLFYYALEGAGWNNQVKALSPDLDECEWNIFLSGGELFGFLCNDSGQVNVISLWLNNLAGTIPNEIGNMTMLSVFNIIGGAIEGTIPSSLSQCKDLMLLGLSYHKLSGTIPDSFATMDKLAIAFFHLNDNLSGFNKSCHLLYDGVLSGLTADCNPTNPVECECCTDCCDDSLPGKEICCFTKYKEEKGDGTEGWCYDPIPT